MMLTPNLLARRVWTQLNTPASTELLSDPDAASFARRLGFEPDPQQTALLTCTDPEILVNCTRQWGKSTTIACTSLFTALSEPDSLILLLSPSQRQSGELFRKVQDFYYAYGKAAGYYPSERETVLTLQLTNGSRIVSLPGKEGTIRGFSGARLIVIDEAARVPDELYYAIRPMLAVSGGHLIAMSTPYGKRGWWFEAWTGPHHWTRFRVPATECPRIPPEFLAQERLSMPEWYFLQEYMCEFQEAETAAFRYEDVMAALNDEKVEAWTF